MTMKTVIVTGANGFIGSHLCNTLADKGVQVIAVVNGDADNLYANRNITIFKNNSDLVTNLKSVAEGADCMYHFAWAGAYASSDYSTQLNNILNTCNMVKLAKTLNCKKFLFPGTVMEYSFADVVTANHSKPGLRNYYYTSKQAANLMAKTLSTSLGIAYIEAAITNAFGPGSNKNSFMNSVLLKMMRGADIDLTPGTQLYDFIYISDLISALEILGEKGESNCMYYVGSDHPRSIRDYVHLMQKCVGSNSKLNFGAIQESPVGLNCQAFDILAIYRDLGFSATVGLEEGIRKTIMWLDSL